MSEKKFVFKKPVPYVEEVEKKRKSYNSENRKANYDGNRGLKKVNPTLIEQIKKMIYLGVTLKTIEERTDVSYHIIKKIAELPQDAVLLSQVIVEEFASQVSKDEARDRDRAAFDPEARARIALRANGNIVLNSSEIEAENEYEKEIANLQKKFANQYTN